MIVRKFFTAPWQVLGSFLGGCWNVIEKLFASSWEVTGNSWRRLLRVLARYCQVIGRLWGERFLSLVQHLLSPGWKGGGGSESDTDKAASNSIQAAGIHLHQPSSDSKKLLQVRSRVGGWVGSRGT